MSLGFLIQAFRSVTLLSFLIPLQWYIARIWRCESCSWWTLLCWTHRRFDAPTTTLYRCSWYWIITHSPFLHLSDTSYFDYFNDVTFGLFSCERRSPEKWLVYQARATHGHFVSVYQLGPHYLQCCKLVLNVCNYIRSYWIKTIDIDL